MTFADLLAGTTPAQINQSRAVFAVAMVGPFATLDEMLEQTILARGIENLADVLTELVGLGILTQEGDRFIITSDTEATLVAGLTLGCSSSERAAAPAWLRASVEALEVLA